MGRRGLRHRPGPGDGAPGPGGTVAASPGDAVARADVAVTSLPTVDALADVTAGLTARPRPGLVVVETSTLPAAAKRQARDALAGRGAVLLDCPLSGTGGQALTGDVVAYLSGPAEAKARALPVLRAMTRGVHDVGEFGNGSAIKFVANLLVAIHNVAAAEALVLAERAGLDLATVLPRSPTGRARRPCSRSAARRWPPATTRGPA